MGKNLILGGDRVKIVERLALACINLKDLACICTVSTFHRTLFRPEISVRNSVRGNFPRYANYLSKPEIAEIPEQALPTQ